MSKLPEHQINPQRVFSQVRIDYAGPLSIKEGNPRKPIVTKAYICLFACLAVKAAHIELVKDLSTPMFMAALQRFISRCGVPSHVYSDHDTNFVGADRELNELYQWLDRQHVQTEIQDSSCNLAIEWHFILEHSPHSGGLWEAAVKSTKVHL